MPIPGGAYGCHERVSFFKCSVALFLTTWMTRLFLGGGGGVLPLLQTCEWIEKPIKSSSEVQVNFFVSVQWNWSCQSLYLLQCVREDPWGNAKCKRHYYSELEQPSGDRECHLVMIFWVYFNLPVAILEVNKQATNSLPIHYKQEFVQMGNKMLDWCLDSSVILWYTQYNHWQHVIHLMVH